MNLSFSEKLILMLISQPPIKEGQIKLNFPSWIDLQLNFYASCGVIIDLLSNKRIEVISNEVRVSDNSPTGIPYIDSILQTINKSPDVKTFDYWINFFSDIDTHGSGNKFCLYKKVEAALMENNLITFKKSRYLFFFTSEEVFSTPNGQSTISKLIDDINRSINEGKFENSTLLLTILLGPDFADMLKYYLDKKQLEVLSNLINNPSFKMDYTAIFFTADEITQAFYGK